MSEKGKKKGIYADEFERQYQEATKRGQEEIESLPKAVSAKYDRASRRFIIEMLNGVTLLVPVDLVQGLGNGSDRELSDLDLKFNGTEIHWNALDVQFYVRDLLLGIFGTPRWMKGLKEHLADIGRKGGSAKTPAKRAASVENGKKGGRPRKKRTA